LATYPSSEASLVVILSLAHLLFENIQELQVKMEFDSEINFSRKTNYVILGSWKFSPKHQTLNDGEITKELEPLLFGILSYLIKNNDRIITRQELIDEVWKQNYVDDNAINRAMSQLRKALKSEKQRAQIIKTHYRVGYSLTVVPEIVYHSAPQNEEKKTLHSINVNEGGLESQNESSPSNKWYRLFIVSFVFILAIASIAVFQFSSTSKSQPALPPLAVKETLLSWKKGISVAPLMAKSGRYLSYTFRSSDSTTFDLFIKNTKTLEEIRISENGAQLYPIAWSVKDELFYQIIDAQAEQPCQVWKVDIAKYGMNGSHEKLFDCYGINLIHADTADNGNTLLYTKFNYRNIPNLSSIVHRNLETQTEFQISSPQVSEFGDYFVKVSNSGDKVAILRHQAKGMKILVANKDGSNQREVATSDYFVDAINWSADDAKILWLNRDDKTLAKLSMSTLEVTHQPLDTQAINGGKIGIDFVGENALLVATDYADTNLYSWNSSEGAIQDFSSTNRLEIAAAGMHAKDETIYIVGWKEQSLWIEKGQSRRQLLSELPDKRISYIAISPDDTQFVLANKDAIFIYDFSSLALKEKLTPPGSINGLSWTRSNSLLIAVENDAKTASWLYEISSRKYALLVSDIIGQVEMVAKNTIIYLNNNHNLIEKNIDTGEKRTLLRLSSAPKLRWAANKNSVFYSKDATTIFRKGLGKGDDKVEKIADTREKEIWKLIANDSRQSPELFLVLIEQKNNMLLKLEIESEY